MSDEIIRFIFPVFLPGNPVNYIFLVQCGYAHSVHCICGGSQVALLIWTTKTFPSCYLCYLGGICNLQKIAWTENNLVCIFRSIYRTGQGHCISGKIWQNAFSVLAENVLCLKKNVIAEKQTVIVTTSKDY